MLWNKAEVGDHETKTWILVIWYERNWCYINTKQFKLTEWKVALYSVIRCVKFSNTILCLYCRFLKFDVVGYWKYSVCRKMVYLLVSVLVMLTSYTGMNWKEKSSEVVKDVPSPSCEYGNEPFQSQKCFY